MNISLARTLHRIMMFEIQHKSLVNFTPGSSCNRAWFSSFPYNIPAINSHSRF